MVKLGWMQDSHINDDGNDSNDGTHDAIATDIDTLGGTYGVEDIYWTGDQVAPNETSNVPHVDDGDYNRFWNLVDSAMYSDLVRYAIPGNHDIPIQSHLRADDRAVLRARVDYNGVTVLLVNTHANSFVTGSPGGPGQLSGIGQTTPRVPYRDIKWMDDQLADAGSNAKLVLPHAPLFLFASTQTSDGRSLSSNPERKVMTDPSDRYEFPENFNFVHKTLQKHNKVVVPCSHISHQGSGGRGNASFDGVDYIYKNHYYDGGSNEASTFGYIDITSSSVTIKTVEHSDGTEYSLLDKTF